MLGHYAVRAPSGAAGAAVLDMAAGKWWAERAIAGGCTVRYRPVEGGATLPVLPAARLEVKWQLQVCWQAPGDPKAVRVGRVPMQSPEEAQAWLDIGFQFVCPRIRHTHEDGTPGAMCRLVHSSAEAEQGAPVTVRGELPFWSGTGPALPPEVLAAGPRGK